MEQERKKLERQTKRQVTNRKEVAFTKEEHQRYTSRHENGYDIPEERYCQCNNLMFIFTSTATRVTRSQSNRYLCSSDGSVGNVISKPSSKGKICILLLYWC